VGETRRGGEDIGRAQDRGTAQEAPAGHHCSITAL